MFFISNKLKKKVQIPRWNFVMIISSKKISMHQRFFILIMQLYLSWTLSSKIINFHLSMNIISQFYLIIIVLKIKSKQFWTTNLFIMTCLDIIISCPSHLTLTPFPLCDLDIMYPESCLWVHDEISPDIIKHDGIFCTPLFIFTPNDP